MPSGESASVVATGDRSLIFSQGDREIGRFLGFERRATKFGATLAPNDRYGVVQPLDFSLSEIVIGACIEVHRLLGPGLLESIYESCVCHELTLRGLAFERQRPVSVEYKGTPIDQGYRIDLIVEDKLILEIKAVDALLPIHAAQVVTYLRVTGLETGLLVNFNSLTIRSGLRRLSRTPKSSRSPDLPVNKI